MTVQFLRKSWLTVVLGLAALLKIVGPVPEAEARPFGCDDSSICTGTPGYLYCATGTSHDGQACIWSDTAYGFSCVTRTGKCSRF